MIKSIKRKLDRKRGGKPPPVELYDINWPYHAHNPEKSDITNNELKTELIDGFADIHNVTVNKLNAVINSITIDQWRNNRKFWYTLIINTILTTVGLVIGLIGLM